MPRMARRPDFLVFDVSEMRFESMLCEKGMVGKIGELYEMTRFGLVLDVRERQSLWSRGRRRRR